MAYRIATSETGKTFIVLAQDAKIIRVVCECEDRADADRLLRNLGSWRL